MLLRKRTLLRCNGQWVRNKIIFQYTLNLISNNFTYNDTKVDLYNNEFVFKDNRIIIKNNGNKPCVFHGPGELNFDPLVTKLELPILEKTNLPNFASRLRRYYLYFRVHIISIIIMSFLIFLGCNHKYNRNVLTFSCKKSYYLTIISIPILFLITIFCQFCINKNNHRKNEKLN